MKSRNIIVVAILSAFIAAPVFADRFSDFMHNVEKSMRDSDDDRDSNRISNSNRVPSGGGGTRWASYDGSIPMNAVIGGQEPGRVLYICQASYDNGVHPGKVIGDRCNITFDGREIPRSNFNVLVGYGYSWKHVYGGEMPMNAVAGGYERGRPLYICQAQHGNGSHIGKVVLGVCNIGYAGAEIKKTDFRVLVRGGGGRRGADEGGSLGAAGPEGNGNFPTVED